MALPYPLPFGIQLKRERLARGLTQEALAARAGLSTRAISDLERGINRTPRKETLRLLDDALQLSPDARARLEATLHQTAISAGTLAAPERRASSAADPTSIPLAGRADELARLAQHLARGADEGPPLLLLAGEPGIGKTRLLRESAQQAFVCGWTVLEGGCHRQSGQEPYTPVLDALADYLHQQPLAQGRRALAGCAWLVRLLPELADQGLLPSAPWKLPPEQERRLMFVAIERLLTNIAGPAGTLLVLDDLQWAGADALALVQTLVCTTAQMPFRMLGSYRSTEVRPGEPLATLVADLAAAGLAAQLDLPPLAPEEAAMLLTSLLDGGDGSAGTERAQAEQIVQRAGGVPFFLVSCAQVLRQHPMANGAQATTQTPEEVPWTVAQSIRQRLAVLPPAARDLLGAAAVIGRSVSGALVQALALQPEREALAALEAACQARLLTEDADGYQFPHDLIREVLLADLSAARRRLLHRLVAQALEQQPGEPPLAQLADHWVSAGERAQAAAALERAGDHAQALSAFAEAEGYYRDGLAQLDAQGRIEGRARLNEKLGNALTIQDRYVEALTVFAQAAEGFRANGDQEGQWRALAQSGWVQGHRGTFQEGLAQLEPSIEALEPGLISPGLAAMYAALAFLAFGSSQYSKQLAFARHAVHLAQTLKDTTLLIQANHAVSVALYVLGHTQESLHPQMEAIQLAEQAGDLWNLAKGLCNLSSRYLLWGAFDQSKTYVERACGTAEQLGWSALMANIWFNRAEVAFYRGEWAEAQTHYVRAATLGRESGGIWGVGYPAFGRGQLALVQGQREAASRHLEDAMELAERGHDLALLRGIQRALAEQELLLGQPEAARARLTPLLDQADQEELDVTELLPLLAWATLDSGNSAEAEALLSTCLRRARKQEALIVVPDALRVQARLERQRERWAKAEAALDEALTLCRSMPYPYAEAKALYAYGQLHRQQGELQQAREHFEAARAICARLGERLYAEQIEHAMAGLARP
jgi:tetratricopeptide (TPR) repeat protein/transcriptional regulator with XRE-family HTH domain